MSNESNILIDGNGNDVHPDFDSGNGTATESECESEASKSGILSLFWKRIWPPKEPRVKYELREKRSGSSAYSSNRSSATSSTMSSGFWSSLLTSFGKSEDEDYYEGAVSMSMSSGENSPSPERVPLTAETRDLDRLYDEERTVPKSKTNGKSSSGKQSPLPKVRTRREVILSNNKRYERKYFHKREGWGGNANELTGHDSSDEYCGSRTSLMKNGEANDGSLVESRKQISLQSLAGSQNPDSINSNEFTHHCWNIRNQEVRKENFYNVNEMDMYKLYKSGRQSDVTVRCRGKDFKVHTFVLKAQSAHFRRILFTQTEGDPIVINEILPDDMEALLLYMYTGKVNNKYCDRHGGITSRFEILLQDYEVPLPEDSTVMIPIITTDFIY